MFFSNFFGFIHTFLQRDLIFQLHCVSSLVKKCTPFPDRISTKLQLNLY
jgi:hypothetical protein